jgi:hypothetical protein
MIVAKCSTVLPSIFVSSFAKISVSVAIDGPDGLQLSGDCSVLPFERCHQAIVRLSPIFSSEGSKFLGDEKLS